MSKYKSSNPFNLKYHQPAAIWEEALPLGNGHMGAMVFGGTAKERFQLNEDTLWSGFPRDTNNYEALRYLKRVRGLVNSGNYTEAEQIINSRMLGVNTQAYLTMGDLYIEHKGAEACSSYLRELDLDSGIASVSYSTEVGAFSREAWISAPDDVFAIQLSSKLKGGLDLVLSLDSPLRHTVRQTEEDKLVMLGRCPTHIADNYHRDHPSAIRYEEGLGIAFELHLQVMNTGGEVKCEDGKLVITGADRVVLLLASATDYEELKSRAAHLKKVDSARIDKFASPAESCERRLKAAAAKSYTELRQRHTEDHRRFFRRVELDLGSRDKDDLPTDQRLTDYKKGEEDPALEALL